MAEPLDVGQMSVSDNVQENVGEETFQAQVYQESLDMLLALGYTPSEEDCTVLQFCVQSSLERACRFCNTAQPPQALSVLVRMTLGEFLIYLRGASRSFAIVGGKNGDVKTIKEGDVSITYETGTSNIGATSSDMLIDSFCGAIEELVSERKLSW